MVELAQEHHPAVVADATALPFADEAFDLGVAYMSLMNMDDLEGAVRETARVLEPGGRFCVSVVHPVAAAGSWTGDEFAVADYFNGPVNGRRSSSACVSGSSPRSAPSQCASST
jgi:ubiquinone/menaquinone biosynthesis C-methylase UbiE